MSGKSAGAFDVYLFSRGPVGGDDKGGGGVGGTPGGDHSKSLMQVSKYNLWTEPENDVLRLQHKNSNTTKNNTVQ